MHQSEIKVGHIYALKISGKIQPVEVIKINQRIVLGSARQQYKARYTGKNINTGREVVFTAAKCRYEMNIAV